MSSVLLLNQRNNNSNELVYVPATSIVYVEQSGPTIRATVETPSCNVTYTITHDTLTQAQEYIKSIKAQLGKEAKNFAAHEVGQDMLLFNKNHISSITLESFIGNTANVLIWIKTASKNFATGTSKPVDYKLAKQEAELLAAALLN